MAQPTYSCSFNIPNANLQGVFHSQDAVLCGAYNAAGRNFCALPGYMRDLFRHDCPSGNPIASAVATMASAATSTATAAAGTAFTMVRDDVIAIVLLIPIVIMVVVLFKVLGMNPPVEKAIGSVLGPDLSMKISDNGWRGRHRVYDSSANRETCLIYNDDGEKREAGERRRSASLHTDPEPLCHHFCCKQWAGPREAQKEAPRVAAPAEASTSLLEPLSISRGQPILALSSSRDERRDAAEQAQQRQPASSPGASVAVNIGDDDDDDDDKTIGLNDQDRNEEKFVEDSDKTDESLLFFSSPHRSPPSLLVSSDWEDVTRVSTNGFI
ncbi:hypothetical protein BJ170DRAFT_592790 [Xylariales sp. AK1849]|nr:hypothetical protein BJ170DRAFT_592790 [Xylariales sp. AK1849]